VLGFAVPFASLSENAGQNYFAESNSWCFDFSSSNFSLQDHTLSTAGAANTASPVVPSMWPCKNIFHIQFSFFSFCNPTHKTETGTAKQIGETLLIATYLDQSLWWANQKYWPSDHIYYSLFCRCTVLLRPLPATPNCAIMLSQNHFPEPNRHVLTFSSSNVTVQITYSHYWRCSKVFLQSLRKRKSIMTSR
jgi:hypothetical protein